MENKKLVMFLYILMRDELPAGTIEHIMKNHVNALTTNEIVTSSDGHKMISATYSNKFLEDYAQALAKRLND